MRFHPAIAITTIAVLSFAGRAAAQFAAVPPERSALERLNLRSEWTSFIPIEGRDDGIGQVQVADEDQVFVQTKAGLLIALDARTGHMQWSLRYPAANAPLYPVGYNDRFVYAVNVTRLVIVHRYSGLVEFDYEMPGAITSGPVPDRDLVYVILNGTRVMAYKFPSLIKAADQADRRRAPGAGKPVNPADAAAARFATGTGFPFREESFDQPRYKVDQSEPAVGLGTIQRTPSLSALPSITPPYTLQNRLLASTPSLAVVANLRQPYHYRAEFMQYNQRTPSVSAIPPSIARVHQLANLRPRAVTPDVVWAHGVGRRLQFEPILTDTESYSPKEPRIVRLWATTDNATRLISLTRTNGDLEIDFPLQDTIASPLSGPAFIGGDVLLGFVGLVDGNLVAVDLLRGGEAGIRVEWRANVGGLINHKPLATPDAVFASGDNSGLSKIDIQTGELLWKTERNVDRVVAVNDEFVYGLDRTGTIQLFDRKKPGTGDYRVIGSVGQLSMTGFDVKVMNEQTDRIVMAANSGIMVCLRDASPKYSRPVRIAAPGKPVVKKVEPKDPAMMPEDPPKEEPKKEEPKKEAPKKEIKKDEPKKEMKKDDN
ncbi:PQQ-binding-like beta-propeller repeat protein [Fimbriiglobus ruber]|uniref:Pyrrolo-quinoline quinone repeat domain-containing protein n=1 Tax=Fimbriiglobus ruber TaxID=1908690 RepID=A0A225EE29_9BACT|nr:PQQ-binding-like beta-propeller repeat protein [Fimbriiglobus ruber]OWK46567.1 hypothetical protein FRUB_00266 [Fimbriiglobus ruber]